MSIYNYFRHLIVNQLSFSTIFNVNEALEGDLVRFTINTIRYADSETRLVFQCQMFLDFELCHFHVMVSSILSSRATLQPVYKDYPTLVYVSLSTLCMCYYFICIRKVNVIQNEWQSTFQQ